jgi:MoaA/NifB/PqqE/SkfB family radical SAM enzyme
MFIDKRWPDLAAAGLDQIVVSIDSPYSETHDKLRKTEGLYRNALGGIARIRAESPSTLIRVNTVVGKHNLESLPDMFVLLHELGVKQWSLIPLKPFPTRFHESFENTWFSIRERLLSHVAQLGEPRLMGNSLDLFGNNIENHRRIMGKGCPETPQAKCELVEWIRYLDLTTQRVFSCNCVPHRGKQADELGESWTPNSWGESALASSRKWLRDNGPSQCTGCEPLNAALGEGRIDLNEDLFGF